MILEDIPTDNTVYAWCGEYFITLTIWQEKFPVEMLCALHYAERIGDMLFSRLVVSHIRIHQKVVEPIE